MSLGSPRGADTIMAEYGAPAADLRSIATTAAVSAATTHRTQLQQIYGRVDTYNDFMQEQINEDVKKKNANKFFKMGNASIEFKTA